MPVNFDATIATFNENMPVNINAEIATLNEGIQVDLSSWIIYAFSPIAKVELQENGSYLITITDKNGTTTAEVPIVSPETIGNIIAEYFQQNPIVENAIQQHNTSEFAHQNLRKIDLLTQDNIVELYCGTATEVI